MFYKKVMAMVVLLASVLMAQAQVQESDKGPAEQDKFVEQNKKKQEKELKKRQKKKERIDTRRTETYAAQVSMFAVSSEFGDSVVYLTELQDLDSIRLTRKYDYLYFRSDYSYQFTQYLGEAYDAENQTTSVFFDKKRKRLTKRFLKVMKRYEADPSIRVLLITADKFRFKPVDADTYLNI